MAEDAPKPNRGGRPSKYPGQGRRPTLSLRVRGGLYEKLQAAAAKSERTVSEEMERRLEASFEIADAATSAGAAARQAIDEAQDAFAVQAIHSTLEELQEDLGHPYALAVAMHMGQGFTAAHNKLQAEHPPEFWYNNPDRIKFTADLLHQRVDELAKSWQIITHSTSFWDLFQKYRKSIFEKRVDGTYKRRSEEARARREAEEATAHEA